MYTLLEVPRWTSSLNVCDAVGKARSRCVTVRIMYASRLSRNVDWRGLARGVVSPDKISPISSDTLMLHLRYNKSLDLSGRHRGTLFIASLNVPKIDLRRTFDRLVRRFRPQVLIPWRRNSIRQ